MTTTWVPAPPRDDTFASRLRLLRLALDDMSVEEIAKKCDVPAPTWRSWERGALPRDMAQVAARLQASTGADRDWLMWGASDATLSGPKPPYLSSTGVRWAMPLAAGQ